jgi:serine/threonine protein kinase/formylglycine-generating enzyme required for sulfatase activity
MADDIFGLVGHTIDNTYVVQRQVGEGGFGVVYEAEDRLLKMRVALKCLKIPAHFTEDVATKFFDKFVEEARLLARLSEHPSIVRVHRFGQAPSALGTLPYLAMEWLTGRDLEHELQARTAKGDVFDELEAITLLTPIVEAIAFAHQQGVVHRDIKPANIFLAQGIDGQVRPKMLDFGIAKVMQDGETATQLATKTSSGFSAFSAQFAAPEQFLSKRYGPTGPWTDVHALGIVFASLTSGRGGLAEEYGECMIAAMDTLRPTPRTWGGHVSDAFEAVVAKAVSQDPKHRYPHAGALLEGLKSLASPSHGRQEIEILSIAESLVPTDLVTAKPTELSLQLKKDLDKPADFGFRTGPPVLRNQRSDPKIPKAPKVPETPMAPDSPKPPRPPPARHDVGKTMDIDPVEDAFEDPSPQAAPARKEAIDWAPPVRRFRDSLASLAPPGKSWVLVAIAAGLLGLGSTLAIFVLVFHHPRAPLAPHVSTTTAPPTLAPIAMPSASASVAEVASAPTTPQGPANCPPNMVGIPKGSFRAADAKVHNVNPFCIDRTEVTVAAFSRCLDAHTCTEPGHDRGCNWGTADRAQHPINCVDYAQAGAYCAWAGGRLPTEDEWQWAARGGDVGSLYPWGSEPPNKQLCWNGEGNTEGKGSRNSTCPVGSFGAGDNPWGVHDLAGNVWEFVVTQPAADGEHTVAGGGWKDDDATDVSAFGRGHGPPMYRYFNIGFRCAKAP